MLISDTSFPTVCVYMSVDLTVHRFDGEHVFTSYLLGKIEIAWKTIGLSGTENNIHLSAGDLQIFIIYNLLLTRFLH